MAGNGRHDADEALAAQLAAGLTVPAAAAKVGVGERTVRRRLKDPAFRQQVNDLKAEIVSRGVSILGRSMSGAAAELAKLMTSKDERIRLHAAKSVIELTIKTRAAEDLERRIANLESRLLEEQGGGVDGTSDETGEEGTDATESNRSDA